MSSPPRAALATRFATAAFGASLAPSTLRLRGRPRALRLVLAASMALVTACGEKTRLTAPAAPVNAAAYVTAEVARVLDAQGHFVLVDPPKEGLYPELTRAQATAIATRWLRDFGRFLRGSYEKWRGGGAIDLASLKPCPQVFYSAASHEPVPGDELRELRNATGPQWLVSFCPGGSGAPQVSVAVASYATQADTSTGILIWPGRGPSGGEVFTLGIPLGADFPVAPERAVELVATATGQRIARVPELVRPAAFWAPQLSRWKLVLDGPAHVRGIKSGVESDESELYVGVGDDELGSVAILRAAAAGHGDRPDPHEQVMVPVSADLAGPQREVLLTRRAGVPRTFERVIPTGKGR